MIHLLGSAVLIAASIAYGIYALQDPAAATSTAVPSAFIALMVSLAVSGWLSRSRERGH